MKKLILFVISLCLIGCKKPAEKPQASQERPLVTLAKQGLADYIDKFAVNSETYKVKNFHVVVESDSLCVFNFKEVAENGLGGVVTKQRQYTLLKDGDVYYDHFQEHPIDKKRNEAYYSSFDLEFQKERIEEGTDYYKHLAKRYKEIKDGNKDYLNAWLILTGSIYHARQIDINEIKHMKPISVSFDDKYLKQ